MLELNLKVKNNIIYNTLSMGNYSLGYKTRRIF